MGRSRMTSFPLKARGNNILLDRVHVFYSNSASIIGINAERYIVYSMT